MSAARAAGGGDDKQGGDTTLEALAARCKTPQDVAAPYQQTLQRVIDPSRICEARSVELTPLYPGFRRLNHCAGRAISSAVPSAMR